MKVSAIVNALFCILLIILVHGTCAWYLNRPQDAGPDVPSGKLRSLSFAPYREGFSPIEEKFPLPQHIDEDLSLLADKTYCVRTYSVRGGMEPTPGFARKYGVEMIQGGWLGDGEADNRKEIDALIQSANANPDVVKRVIVGNEVLLRKDLTIDQLITHIREVKQAIKQPVSYADVWSSYMKYPQLFNEVDYITIHILPYWEDEPVAIDRAVDHVEKIVKQIEAKAREVGANKPILIGESGWPGVGRQRGNAVPSIVNETRFIRSLIQVANRHGFDYNIVEAFNQPWKSHNEGVVGANWGLLSIDREPVFPLTGPVSENPDWPLAFAAATALWLGLAAAYWKRLAALPWLRLLLWLTMVQILSICLVTLADFLWQTSYSHWQRSYTVLIVAANAALAALLSQRSQDILTDTQSAPTLAARLGNTYLLFSLLALYKTYALALNGRYLSFPVEQFAIPVIGILGLSLCSLLRERRFDAHSISFDRLLGSHWRAPNYRFWAYALALGMVGVVLGETYEFLAAYDFIQAHPEFSEGLPVALSYTLENRQLLAWLFCVMILSLPFWLGHRNRQRRPVPHNR